MDDRLRHFLNLGREHYSAGEYEKAEEYLTEFTRHHDAFPDLLNMLGVIYSSTGRFDEAELAFERALEINPNYTEAALNLSVTYNDRGKYQEARAIYSRAISNSRADEDVALDPFARGKLANMHFEVAKAYAAVAQYPSAVAEFGKALELCPAFVDIRTELANVYREMGQPSRALAELRLVKREKPEYLPARLALGVTLFSLGRKEEAEQEWREAVSIAPTDRRATIYLRMVSDQESAPKPGSALADEDL